MNVEAQKLRGAKKHTRSALPTTKTCIDCHKGIAHQKPEGMKEDDDE
jgi:cytochrome c-type protein NapC